MMTSSIWFSNLLPKAKLWTMITEIKNSNLMPKEGSTIVSERFNVLPEI